ncbi:MAG: TetR/AcrR family transcriptional regulator [Novosphingobium sp.]|nr:TetR/AcrR family transcriptional regulator [Novosphingobium sp.]
MSIRKRLTPEEIRSAALDAAEAILMELGPQALTLKAVAARIGRTHANVLHHFGSAAGLHEALARHMANRYKARMVKVIRELHEGKVTVRHMVEVLFDSTVEDGGVQLMTWLLLTRNEVMLDSIMKALKEQIDEFDNGRNVANGMVDLAILTHLVAMGDALMGEAMTRMLGKARERPRELVTQIIEDWLRATVGTATGPIPETFSRAAE